VLVHVRVRDRQALRERLRTVSSHAETAAKAGMSPARLSQILTGRAPVIKMEQAARLEDVLGVRRGTFFSFAEDTELVAEFVAAEVPEPAEPVEDMPAGDTEWCPVAGSGEG
jgi:transcriptional regulator with XRE-family HTH domain